VSSLGPARVRNAQVATDTDVSWPALAPNLAGKKHADRAEALLIAEFVLRRTLT
jgi:hypothetical protein